MSVKVAINGFGRIGRLAFRQMFGAQGYDVVAINDLTKPSMLANLLKYDTAQGGYCGKIGENLHTVSADDEANTITVDGKTLTIYKEADASKLPWGEISYLCARRKRPQNNSVLGQRKDPHRGRSNYLGGVLHH